MKKALFVIAMIGVSPASAQDTAEEAAEAAAEAVADPEVASPAPPPIQARPAVPAEEVAVTDRFDRYVTAKNYNTIRPRPSDYPLDAWQADEEGLVGYEVEVNAQGKPVSCAITESSGSSALDETTCAIIMERGEFDPAKDDDGNSIAATYTDSHYWQKREPEFPGTMTVRVAFDVDENGTTTDCEVLELSGEISERMQKTFDREPCPGMGRSSQPPFRDELGNPVARRVELTLSVKVDEPTE